MDTPLRILLVEDDPTSSRFIAAALQALPAQVDLAESQASAIELALATGHDLWLVDARLPDGDGIALLHALRARGLTTRALAHTASLDRHDHDALLAAGFRKVLCKPLAGAELRAAVHCALGLREPRPPAHASPAAAATHAPLWDDDAALRALNGNHAHVAQLRGLFVAELEDTGAALMAHWRDDDLECLEAGLHRLRASCGFVGAVRLGAAVAAWQAAPREVEPRSSFERALRDTLAQPPG
ncbi:response regulator [Marilutibacter aestuarii]|uniref:Response regulator n=1 Tax=Marilutibacter aestuarii TaxID=1706195 RepID=A0A508ADD7_9GAMM|nr:response regulator [Lysobacter aestuarii]TQD45075.1 response regulator [Lysobacter aestuarii]